MSERKAIALNLKVSPLPPIPADARQSQPGRAGAGTGMMRRHWIAPHSGLFVTDYGYHPEESAKLAAAAAKVWKSIGFGDRRRIAALRRGCPSWSIEIPPGQLEGHYPDGYLLEGNWTPVLANVWYVNGLLMEMRFDGETVKRMPDDALRGLVAHEFAHLAFRAAGCPTPTDTDDYDEEELEADIMATRWVLDDFEAYEKWSESQCLTTS